MEPILLRTIQTKECRGITGFSVVCEKMYVAGKECSKVEVFDLMNSDFICRWKVNGLKSPGDLTSCTKFMCIYIMDAKYIGESSEIIKLDLNGNIIHRWYVQDNCGCMSVTLESNIIVAAYETHRICEYAPDGSLLRQLYLLCCGISHPMHVLNLTESRFLVSYGSFNGQEHGLCVIEADGEDKNALSGIAGHSSCSDFDVPLFMALDSVGNVLVADCENSRVLLLNSCLQLKTQLLSYAEGFRHPYRLYIDSTSNMLIVSVNDGDMEDGRILVYEINKAESNTQLSDAESFNAESDNDDDYDGDDDFLYYDT